MSNQERIADLLVKQSTGTITEEELRELTAWADAAVENRVFLEQYLQVKQLYDGVEMRSLMDERSMDSRVYAMIGERASVRFLSRPVVRWLAAASVIAVVSVVGVLIFQRSGSSRSVATTNVLKQPTNFPAGSNRARLQLSNGDVIELDTAKNGSIAMQSGARVVKNGAAVSYAAGSASASDADIYNILSTPKSGQYQLVLPDGTKVWLNNVSTLRYPVAFNGRSRRVELTGEAYFEVAKNVSKPFYVATDHATIEVLGTSFNVSSYADEKLEKTTLIDGKIKVKTSADSLVLMPGEQAEGERAKLTVRHPDVYSVISWRRGFFNFSDANVEMIMKQIARWYGVAVRYEGRPVVQKFEGSISREQDLKTTLEALELLHIHTRLENDTVVVLP